MLYQKNWYRWKEHLSIVPTVCLLCLWSMITWILTRTKLKRISVEKIFDFVLFKIEWNRSDSNTLDHAAPRNFVIQYIDDTFLWWNESKLVIEANFGALNVFSRCGITKHDWVWNFYFTLMSTWLHDLMRLFWMGWGKKQLYRESLTSKRDYCHDLNEFFSTSIKSAHFHPNLQVFDPNFIVNLFSSRYIDEYWNLKQSKKKASQAFLISYKHQ